MANEPTFTDAQMANFKKWVKLQNTGRFNMLDPRARTAMSMSEEDHLFVLEHYEEMLTQYTRKAK